MSEEHSICDDTSLTKSTPETPQDRDTPIIAADADDGPDDLLERLLTPEPQEGGALSTLEELAKAEAAPGDRFAGSEPEASGAPPATAAAKEGTWFKVDVHIHANALASEDSENALLAILRQADEKALDMIGLVDHNSVRGYEQLRLETGRLAVLREAGRLLPEQDTTLREYAHLLAQIVLLPGFEITTQEGIGLLALFSPDTSAEHLNALLLNLGIPMERLREASAETRTQADLSMAALLIAQAGGIVIANYEDAVQNLASLDSLPAEVHALEVTAGAESEPDLPRPAVWSSAVGCKSRQERSHSTEIGANYTEALLTARSFEGLRSALQDSARERLRFPERERLRAYIKELRQQGTDQVIFYGPEADPLNISRDVAALANSGGGILIIGLTEEKVCGVENPERWSTNLTRSVREQVEPQPRLNLELLRYGDKELIRTEVHAEVAPPYITPEGAVYLRRNGQTRPASRQELLELVTTGMPNGGAAPTSSLDLPQAGVEIVGAYLRDGVWYYDVRDLRVTSGVTRQRAKGLWAYAIERQEGLRLGRADLTGAVWKGDRGIWRAYRSGERRVFDLLHRDPSGRIDHIFYGVSEWGLTPRWRDLVESARPPMEEDSPPEASHNERPAREARSPQPRAGAQEQPSAEETAAEKPAEPPRPVEIAAQAAPPPTEPAPLTEPPTAAAAPPAPAADSPDTLPTPDTHTAEDTPGERIPRWRGPAAVERVYWEGNHLLFDLAMRQEGEQVRYYRHIHRGQLADAEGWVDLVRVVTPTTGVEIVRCTVSGEEFLYQFRDPQSGRVDPRVRCKSDFPANSPYAYAIQRHHEDTPLDEAKIHWWGNIGYLRLAEQQVDLVYRDEEGRDHIYYAAEQALLEGEWQKMLEVLRGE